MSELILMVGLPRSGKTTLARKMTLELNAPLVNPDSIRLAIHGQRFVASAEPYVWAVAKTMVTALFGAGHDRVIVDATHGTRRRREFWLSDSWRRVFRVVDTPKETCLERNSGDAAMAGVIERMHQQWEPIAPDERES